MDFKIGDKFYLKNDNFDGSNYEIMLIKNEQIFWKHNLKDGRSLDRASGFPIEYLVKHLGTGRMVKIIDMNKELEDL